MWRHMHYAQLPLTEQIQVTSAQLSTRGRSEGEPPSASRIHHPVSRRATLKGHSWSWEQASISDPRRGLWTLGPCHTALPPICARQNGLLWAPSYCPGLQGPGPPCPAKPPGCSTSLSFDSGVCRWHAVTEHLSGPIQKVRCFHL